MLARRFVQAKAAAAAASAIRAAIHHHEPPSSSGISTGVDSTGVGVGALDIAGLVAVGNGVVGASSSAGGISGLGIGVGAGGVTGTGLGTARGRGAGTRDGVGVGVTSGRRSVGLGDGRGAGGRTGADVGAAVGLGAGLAVGVGRGVTGPLSLSTGPCTVGLGLGVGLGGSWKSCTDCARSASDGAAAARTNKGKATEARRRVIIGSVRDWGAKELAKLR